MSGRHALPKPTVDGVLSAVWGLGSLAALGLLGVQIVDASAHAIPVPVSQPDVETFEAQSDRTGLSGEVR